MTHFPPFPDTAGGEARHAVYFIPEPSSPLARFGASWLGRDCATGEMLPLRPVPGLAGEHVAEITESARGYGFHATLKAPFTLRPAQSEADLRAAMAAFAAEREPFSVRLGLRTLGGFLALMMTPSDYRMNELAADCVRSFEPFRAALSEADLERRRKSGLTPQQEDYLQRWGYPYVMDEFRFHMTLTRRLPDGPERSAILDVLEPLAAEVTAAPVAVDAVALARQPNRASPFTLVERFQFGG